MKLENIIKKLLLNVGQKDLKHPDFKDTPERVTKVYKHFFRNEDPKIHFNKKFPTTNDQIVILKDINVIGLCPHHLLPIEYKVHIGYIPNGFALGLSKFNRVVQAIASYPKLQKNMTDEICSSINKSMKPAGVIVVVEGIHGCMKFRGVKDSTKTITSEISGVFQDNPSTKSEFFSLIRLND
jgi:GTP cyclohydrolase I